MRYFRVCFFVLCVGLAGCSDTSRDDYDFPAVAEVTPEKHLDLILSHLSESIKSNPSNPDNYLKRATWQYKAGNYEKALIDVSQAERLSPNSGDILYLKSAILYRAGKENALENALFAEGQDFESPDLFALIGNLYLDKKDYRRASEYFRKAESLYPYHADIYNGRGRFYAMQRDTITAINNYKRAIQLRPDVFEYYNDLIKIYGQARFVDSALNLNDRAIQQFSEKKELVFNKGLILEKVGLVDSSIRIYRQFLSLEPQRYDVYEKIGDLYFSRKNFSSAFITYNKWAELDTDNPTPQLKAARAYIAQGNLPAAKYYLKKALAKHTDHKGLQSQLAAVEYSLERMSGGYSGNVGAGRRISDEVNTEEDRRVFDRSLDINQIPKRRPTTIGRDTTRN